MSLKDEITNDPLTRGYSGMSDQEVADSLNTVDRTVQIRVSHTDVMTWAASGPRKKVEDNKDNANEALAAASLVALDLIADGVTTFDTSDNGNQTLLSGLVSGGVLSGDDQTALMALGQSTVSRAAELGLGHIRVGDVIAARSI